MAPPTNGDINVDIVANIAGLESAIRQGRAAIKSFYDTAANAPSTDFGKQLASELQANIAKLKVLKGAMNKIIAPTDFSFSSLDTFQKQVKLAGSSLSNNLYPNPKKKIDMTSTDNYFYELQQTAKDVGVKLTRAMFEQGIAKTVLTKKPFIDPAQIKITKDVQAGLVNLDKAFVALEAQEQQVSKEFERMGQIANRNMKKIQKTTKAPPFAGWALTFMLFGMQLKATLDSIWKTSSRTFQEVMHSVEGTVTGFDNLNASVSYLGFTMGQALEPIAAWLAPIVWGIAEWVSEHQSLVTTIFAVLAVLAPFLILLGQVKLLYDGIATLGLILNGAIKTMGVEAGLAGVSVEALSASLGTIMGWALLIAGIAAVIWVAWQTNFADIQGFMDAWFVTMKKTWDGLVKGIKKQLDGFFDILKGFFEGDMDKIMQGFEKVTKGGLENVTTLMTAVIVSIINLWILCWNAVGSIINIVVKLALQYIAKSIKEGISFIQTLVDAYNAVAPKLMLPPIKKNQFDSEGLKKAVDAGVKKAEEFLKFPMTPYLTGDTFDKIKAQLDTFFQVNDVTAMTDALKEVGISAKQVSTLMTFLKNMKIDEFADFNTSGIKELIRLLEEMNIPLNKWNDILAALQLPTNKIYDQYSTGMVGIRDDSIRRMIENTLMKDWTSKAADPSLLLTGTGNTNIYNINGVSIQGAQGESGDALWNKLLMKINSSKVS